MESELKKLLDNYINNYFKNIVYSHLVTMAQEQ